TVELGDVAAGRPILLDTIVALVDHIDVIGALVYRDARRSCEFAVGDPAGVPFFAQADDTGNRAVHLLGGGQCGRERHAENERTCEDQPTQDHRPLLARGPLRLEALPAAFFAFLGLGQPVTEILVFCLTCTPFCPVSMVGMTSFAPQRLPWALAGRLVVSAECGLSGSFSSKLVIGASGTPAKVLLVMP